MTRLIFASLVTAFLLPGLLLPPPASGLVQHWPSLGSAAGMSLSVPRMGGGIR